MSVTKETRVFGFPRGKTNSYPFVLLNDSAEYLVVDTKAHERKRKKKYIYIYIYILHAIARTRVNCSRWPNVSIFQRFLAVTMLQIFL